MYGAGAPCERFDGEGGDKMGSGRGKTSAQGGLTPPEHVKLARGTHGGRSPAWGVEKVTIVAARRIETRV